MTKYGRIPYTPNRECPLCGPWFCRRGTGNEGTDPCPTCHLDPLEHRMIKMVRELGGEGVLRWEKARGI